MNTTLDRQIKTSLALDEAINNLDSARSAYLRAFGWEHTCSTPGSLCLWRRDFTKENYGIMTVPIDTAIHMTRAILDAGSEDEDEGEL